MEDLEKKVIDLWQDTSFPGSFTGVTTFRHELLTRGIDISHRKLQKIMSKVPSYLQNTIRRKTFERRPVYTHGFFSLVQADIAQMFKWNGFMYLLTIIDIYTQNIFGFPLKDKRSETVQKCFEDLMAKYGIPDKIETDQGGEFIGLKSFFKNKKVYMHIKRGFNKASFAEHAIFLLKRKLFLTIRHKNTRDWPAYVDQAVQNLNNTARRSLGNLKPSDLDSREKAAKLDNLVGFDKETKFSDHAKNVETFNETTDLKPGQFVFISTNRSLRSYEVQV